jgi:hypothetical protein
MMRLEAVGVIGFGHLLNAGSFSKKLRFSSWKR